jgi:hypothetical protein
VLKSAEGFQWGPLQQKAFKDLKQYLRQLTTLTPPSSGAPLLLYVATSHSIVSATLVQERQDDQAKKQVPVYFCFLSVKSIKNELHRAGEGTICCIDGLQKKSTLYLVTSHYSTFISASQGHYKKQRSHRKSWKIGSRTK